METQFTPGPWVAGTYKGNPTVFWERGNGTVAIASVHDIASMGDPKANARLIAAAPELYEMLKEAQEHLEYCGYGDKWENECAVASKLPERIEAALTKARQGDAVS